MFFAVAKMYVYHTALTNKIEKILAQTINTIVMQVLLALFFNFLNDLSIIAQFAHINHYRMRR